MPPVNVLIKPASSACNMACRYCFYRDVSENREQSFEGMLSLADMEKIIIAALEYAEGVCSFAFQGGEPTLAGLAFYEAVIALQKKHNKNEIPIRNCLQTNGYLVDEAWASFFRENNFLIGLSLDGPADLHNLNRCDHAGKDTFNRVMRAAGLLTKHQVEYNVLCVVTGRNARSIEKIYQFYQKNHFSWLQFIPCLEPLGQERGKEKYHLSQQEYGDFLVRLFDLWYADLKKGTYVSIRHLDNWFFMLMGERPEACNMAGQCSVQFVVEGDGGVYPCDFYVLDEWRLGTIGEQSFEEMQQSEQACAFIEKSLHVPEECKRCRYYRLCRNGCRRDRCADVQGVLGKNYFCQAYQTFFESRGSQIGEALRLIQQMRGN